MTVLKHIFVLLVLPNIFAHCTSAAPFEVWYPRNAGATYQNLNSVAHGNGRFVAVGAAGTVVVSSNGIDWAAHPSGTTRDLNVVAFADGRFFAGGRGGALIYSTDGDSWTNVTIPTVYDVDAIGFGTTTNYPLGLLVVTVSTNTSPGGSFRSIAILTSTNGVYWETGYIANGSSIGALSSIAPGNNRFVASSPLPGGGGCALVSDNGRTWFQAGSCVNGPAAFGNALFVLGRLFQNVSNQWTLATITSTDGRFWLSPGGIGGSYPPRALCFGGSRFVAVAPEFSTIASSADGTNWTVLRGVTDDGLNSVTYGDGRYVAVGRGGIILSSEDAMNWTHRSSRSGMRLHHVASDNDGFVAVGVAGTVARSTNGIIWEELKAPTIYTLAAVLKTNGHYVIVGDGGTILTGDHVTNLVLQSSGTTAALSGIAFGAGNFIAVGAGGTVLTSLDRTNWSAKSSGTVRHLHDIMYAGGQFVAVGVNGTVVTSRDGDTWASRNSGTTRHLVQVVYGRGRFVAACSAIAGAGPLAITSVDGETWEPAISLHQASGGLAYGNGVFLLWAGSFPGFYASTDAKNWSQHTLWTNLPFGAANLTFNNGTFVGAGSYGLAWQSDPVIGLELSKNGFAQLTVHGPKNSIYRIEGSSNLSDTNSWEELTTLSDEPYIWSDPNSANRRHRVYRAILSP